MCVSFDSAIETVNEKNGNELRSIKTEKRDSEFVVVEEREHR